MITLIRRVILVTASILLTAIRSAAVTPFDSNLLPLNSFAEGMGYSGAALTVDPAIVYWNPAGLAMIDMKALDLTTVYPNLNLPASGSVLIADHLQDESDDFAFGILARYGRFVTANDTAILTSYSIFNPLAFSFRKKKLFSFGVTPKLIMEKGDVGWKYGAAADVGIMLHVASELYGGVSIQNVVGSALRSFKRDAWAGVSWGEYNSPVLLSASLGLEKPRRRSYLARHFSYGGALRLGKKFPELRGGYMRRDGTGWITGGVSLVEPKSHIHLDYSIAVNIANRNDSVQFITWG